MIQKKEIKRRKNNADKKKMILRYVGKFLTFWMAVIGVFGIIRISSSVLAETGVEPMAVSGMLEEQVPVSVAEKTDITEHLQVTVSNWSYGEAPMLPGGEIKPGSVISVDPVFFTYTYGGTAKDGSVLTESTAPPVKAGQYTVYAVYEDASQKGSAQKDFEVIPKGVTPSIEVTGIEKPFDFTDKVQDPLPVIQFADKVGMDQLVAFADFSYDNSQIGNSKTITASNIRLDSNHAENSNYQLNTTSASAAGASIRSVGSANEMKLALNHLKEMIADEQNLTTAEKNFVAQAVIQLNQLPQEQKKALDLNTILYLDKLQNQNLGNGVTVNILQSTADALAPATISVEGATLAAGAAAGEAVAVDITAQKSGDSSVKMELLLSMKKNGIEQPLLYPLLFTMNLPPSVDISRLKLLHVMTDRSETVAFTNLGNQQISFQLSSFSKLLFVEKEVIAESTESSSGSSESKKKKTHKETEEDKEYDYWQSVKRKLRKAKDGTNLTIDAMKYQELPWYIMDVLRDRKTLQLTVQWKGGKTFTIPAGKAQPSDENMVYWPLKYLEELYNKVEVIQPVIMPQPPSVEPQVPKEAAPSKPKKVVVPEQTATEETEQEEISSIEEESLSEETKEVSEEEEIETKAVISENVHQVNTFCLIDLVTGGYTNLGCYWCFIPIIIIVSVIGVMIIMLQEISNRKKKE